MSIFPCFWWMCDHKFAFCKCFEPSKFRITKKLGFFREFFLNERSHFSSWSTPWFFSRNLKPKYSPFGICNHEMLSWAKNLVKMVSKGKKRAYFVNFRHFSSFFRVWRHKGSNWWKLGYSIFIKFLHNITYIDGSLGKKSGL